jgi:hypothetical protein
VTEPRATTEKQRNKKAKKKAKKKERNAQAFTESQSPAVACRASKVRKKRIIDAVVPPTRIERAIFALQVRRLTTWPRRL